MAQKKTGVLPCYENQFQIDTAASGAEASYKNIADCESFSVSFDNGVEEWTPFDTEGWTRRLMTFPGAVISVTSLYSGDSTNVAPLEFDVMSNGKPQITAATLSE